MAPDLNSLPPSQSPEAVAEADRRVPASASEQTSLPSIANPATIPGLPESVSPMQLPRQSPRAGATMRINLHETLPPNSAGDAEPRRNSQSHLYRASSHGRREGWSGSGLPSPRSPVSAALAQGDPHHQRAPSLGELHQELEQEQEAQVNRLLQMIRQQQAQLQQLQSQTTHGNPDHVPATIASGTAVADDRQPTPPLAATQSVTGSTFSVHLPQQTRVLPPSPRTMSHHSSPHSLRSRSRRSSRSSPIYSAALPTTGGTTGPSESIASSGAGRDESAFYVAETQSIIRENQMLRARIRELERRVHEMENPATQGSVQTGTATEAKEEENRMETSESEAQNV